MRKMSIADLEIDNILWPDEQYEINYDSQRMS